MSTPHKSIDNHMNWLPYASLVIGLVAVSLSSIFIRAAQRESAGSLVISMWRCGLASLILLPIVLRQYRAHVRKLTVRQFGLAILSGAFLAVHFASWISSLEYTDVLTSTMLVSTHPLFVALLAPILLGDKMSRAMFIAVLVAVGGGMLITVASGGDTTIQRSQPALGAILSLIGALAVALYYMIGRKLRATLPVIPYICITYGAAAIVLLPMVLVSGQAITGLSGEAYFWMTLTALFPQLIGHSSFNFALGYLSTALVSMTLLGEPIFSTLLAMIFLRVPPPNLLQIAGSALVLGALGFAIWQETRSMRASKTVTATA